MDARGGTRETPVRMAAGAGRAEMSPTATSPNMAFGAGWRQGFGALAVAACVLAFWSAAPAMAQTAWLPGGDFIGPRDLPPDFAALLQRLGGRLTAATNANVSVTGTVTDEKGSRAAQVTVQAPGLLRYQEGQSRVITFNGTNFLSGSGSLSTDDSRVAESLLAHFPDAVLLQIARGGGLLRRIGTGFRTDNGKTPNYKGPWWTVYGFSPGPWTGLSAGQPLQQRVIIAIDEQSGLLSEIRVVENMGTPSQSVTQTKISNWFQQAGQWYPGTIARLENGQQVLSLKIQQGSVGTQVSPATITVQ